MKGRKRKYTPPLLGWLNEKISLPNYRRENGKIRMTKLAKDFSATFELDISPESLWSALVRHRVITPKKQIKGYNVEMTLSQIENKLEGILSKMKEIKTFVG